MDISQLIGLFDRLCVALGVFCITLALLILGLVQWIAKFNIKGKHYADQPERVPSSTMPATNVTHSSNMSPSLQVSNRQRQTLAARSIIPTKAISNLTGQSKANYGAPTRFSPSEIRPILSELPKTRGKAFPDHVPCRLSLLLEYPEGPSVQHKHAEVFWLRWMDGDAFNDCIKVTEDFVKRTTDQSNRTQAGAGQRFAWYRKSLQYCIVELVHKSPAATWRESMDRTDWGKGGRADATEIRRHSENVGRAEEWMESLPQSLSQLFCAERSPTFLLDIELSCTIFESHPSDLCRKSSCAADIRLLLFGKPGKPGKPGKRVWLDQDKKEGSEKTEWFIPKGFLDHFFSLELVRHLINQDQRLNADPIWCEEMKTNDAKERFIRHVHLFCIRLLASIILAELDLRCLYYLWRNSTGASKDSKAASGIKDADIPLNRNALPRGEGYGEIDEGRFETFLSYQGRLRAYDFHQNHQQHEVIEDGVMIPVLRCDSIGDGLNGPVYEVEIPEDHQRFHPNRRDHFALKTIIRNAAVPHKEHESEILTTLAKVPHPHLTPMLASWSQGLRCCILMPLALQNLFDFINKNPPPFLDRSFITWFFQQIHGLAAAIDHIHHLGPAKLGPLIDRSSAQSQNESAGYHHDLKPKNILLYSGGVLKIGDFGTARLQQEITVIGSHKTPNLHCDPEYAAPDLFLTGRASRPHDIWALGCILLEMLVWAFGGQGEVENFMRERIDREAAVSNAAFWHKVPKGAELKDSVKERMTSLKKHGQFKGVFFQLITLIEAMLSVNRAERPLIETVRSRLEKMIRQAKLDLDENGETYFLESTSPRSKVSKRSTFDAPSQAGSDLQGERSRSNATYLHAPPTTLRRHSMGQIILNPRSITEPFPQLNQTNVAEQVVLSGGQFQTNDAQDGSEDGNLTRSTTPKTPVTPLITTMDYDLPKVQSEAGLKWHCNLDINTESLQVPQDQMEEAQ